MSQEIPRKRFYLTAGVLIVIVLALAGSLVYYQSRIGDLQSGYAAAEGRVNTVESKLNQNSVAYQAYSHWSAITARDSNTVMSEYAPDAKLYWLGGPLNGNFTDKNGIQDEWAKFFKANPDVYMNVTDFKVQILGGNRGVVTARLAFFNLHSDGTTTTVRVNYALVYTLKDGNWSLVEEWWSIAPRVNPYLQ